MTEPTPVSGSLCPECGLPPQSPAAVGRSSPWPRRVGWLVAAAVAAIIVIQSWKPLRPPFVQVESARFYVEPRSEYLGESFTRQRLDKIMRSGGDGSLARALRELADKPREKNLAQPITLYASFASSSGEVCTTSRWGWPFMVYQCEDWSAFDNVFRHTDPHLSSSFGIPPEHLGKWDWFSITSGMKFEHDDLTWRHHQCAPLSVISNLFVAALIWRSAWCFCLLASRFRCRKWLKGRFNRLLALLAVGGVAIASVGIDGSKSPWVFTRTEQVYSVDGLALDRVRSLTARDEPEVASLILDACPQQHGYLAADFIEFVPSVFTQTSYGWPMPLFNTYSYERIPQDEQNNPAKQFAATEPLTNFLSGLGITVGHWAEVQRRTVFWLYGQFFALLGLLWLLAHLTTRLSRFLLRRRGTKRERLNLCVSCGYPLRTAQQHPA